MLADILGTAWFVVLVGAGGFVAGMLFGGRFLDWTKKQRGG